MVLESRSFNSAPKCTYLSFNDGFATDRSDSVEAESSVIRRVYLYIKPKQATASKLNLSPHKRPYSYLGGEGCTRFQILNVSHLGYVSILVKSFIIASSENPYIIVLDLKRGTCLRYTLGCRIFRYYDYKGADAKLAANWIMSDIAAYMKNEELSITEVKLFPQELAELIASIKDGTISGKIGKQILFELLAKGGTVKGMIKEQNLVQIVDPAEIEKMVEKVLADNPKQLDQYRCGKTKLEGYFTGQIMKLSKGKANPVILEKLNAKS